VVGVGVNCASHPSNTAYPAVDLAAAEAVVTPEALLVSLSATMQDRLKQWNRGQGFAAVRADWLKRAAGLGEALQVRLPEREVSGRFQGLDDTGRLLLEQAGTVTAVTAGEVFGFGGR
jgi:BirA family biotin operon repressor/biotin-[acetyl-CoA-carboxylase] ligase